MYGLWLSDFPSFLKIVFFFVWLLIFVTYQGISQGDSSREMPLTLPHVLGNNGYRTLDTHLLQFALMSIQSTSQSSLVSVFGFHDKLCKMGKNLYVAVLVHSASQRKMSYSKRISEETGGLNQVTSRSTSSAHHPKSE